MRWLTLLLIGLVGLAQANLWFGRGSVSHVVSLQAQLQEQQAVNTAARERNARVLAEVHDLREGLEMIEDRARGELGMVKEHEVLVQFTSRR